MTHLRKMMLEELQRRNYAAQEIGIGPEKRIIGNCQTTFRKDTGVGPQVFLISQSMGAHLACPWRSDGIACSRLLVRQGLSRMRRGIVDAAPPESGTS